MAKQKDIIAAMNEPLNRMMGEKIQEFLPIIKDAIPFVSNKVDEFLGDDEKILIIRKIFGKTMGIVVDTSKDYCITNKKALVEEGKPYRMDLTLAQTDDDVQMVFKAEDFIQMILSGKLG